MMRLRRTSKRKAKAMKIKMLTMLAIGALALAAYAGPAKVEPEKVITGEAACAKCILKETKQCQLAITTDQGGAKTTYYLVENDVSKQFGHQVCQARKKLTVTGTVKSVDGKLELTPTKLEPAKE